WGVWSKAQTIHGTPAARYLGGRGLAVPASCPGLRYLPQAAYFHGEAVDERGHKSPRAIHGGPAMLAAFIRPDGRFGGLHFTYLSAEAPPRKLELADPDTGEILNPKKMRGSKTGANILVARSAIESATPARSEASSPGARPHEDRPKRLVIGEGIET